jgi:hypothetical protein
MPSGTTRRTADGELVEWQEAIAAWARVGRPVLERVAGTYGAYVTYQQMAKLVQEAAGITTGVPFRHWIGSVLGELARLERPDEPLLTSLVVRADGTIGSGYIIPIRERGEPDPADLELHAATERLHCYRHYGAEMPADGGRPVFTKSIAAKRAHARPATGGGFAQPAICSCRYLVSATTAAERDRLVGRSACMAITPLAHVALRHAWISGLNRGVVGPRRFSRTASTHALSSRRSNRERELAILDLVPTRSCHRSSSSAVCVL